MPYCGSSSLLHLVGLWCWLAVALSLALPTPLAVFTLHHSQCQCRQRHLVVPSKPGTRLHHPAHPAPCFTLAHQIFATIGVLEFLPSVELISWLEGGLCSTRPELCVRCALGVCSGAMHVP